MAWNSDECTTTLLIPLSMREWQPSTSLIVIGSVNRHSLSAEDGGCARRTTFWNEGGTTL